MLLLTGANGQLGQTLRPLLPEALVPASGELDIADAHAVHAYVEANRITTIINCAAYTAVDAAEDEPERAMRINGQGAENLARTGARLLHVSTDYVFDGAASQPYTETAATNPQSAYGRSKLAGEQAVWTHASHAIILRTGWVCSPFRQNFVKTMLRLGQERETLNVVDDQIGTPTFAADLARAIVALLPRLEEGGKEIYHFSNEGVCSWYDFAYAIMRQAGLPCRMRPIESKDYPVKAKRPPYSVLSKVKIKKKLGIDIPHWTEGLAECLKQFL